MTERPAAGAPATLGDWIAARVPPVPVGYGDRIGPNHPGAPAGVDALTDEARSALNRALGGDPSSREAAFHLLAADGFATWACEAALEGDDPDRTLDGLVDALLG